MSQAPERMASTTVPAARVDDELERHIQAHRQFPREVDRHPTSFAGGCVTMGEHGIAQVDGGAQCSRRREIGACRDERLGGGVALVADSEAARNAIARDGRRRRITYHFTMKA